MAENVYELKKYVGSSNYINFAENLNTEKITTLQHLKLLMSDSEEIKINAEFIRLPENSILNLKELLTYFGLAKFKNEFLSFISIAQSTYLLYNEKVEGKEIQDFLSEKKDLEILFDALESYLFQSRKELHSISFKFQTKPTISIKNFLVIDDIYKSLLQYYSLTKDNFQEKKFNLINEFTNPFNYKKGGQFVVMNLIKCLFQFIKQEINDISDNKALKFCGVYLHICQIPSNRKSDSIAIEGIENSLHLIDHQNLMHLKNGRLNFNL